ncbi:helix-hairpin-helix domain-containing protein [Neorhodopirellula lusitana]|uniref:helix-hairpin-helix domain-containing protein n=1 Tax=Neorhodopirellula lusitana TaxID=445327 RepID=UPI00385132BE
MVVIESSDPIQAAEQIEGLHENHDIAKQLREVADRLAEQQANLFRVRAYRSAAQTIAHLPSPVRQILKNEGVAGLVALPTIGHSIANLIESTLRTGKMPLLDRLRGQNNAEHSFATLDGIGPQLSHRIHEQLHLETLAELREAANDGRLQKVPGLGPKRIEAIRNCLAYQDAGDRPIEASGGDVFEAVAIEELLEIDRDYRERAKDGTLPRIKLSDQDLQTEVWLPVMHTERDGRHYTAMYSNTAHALVHHATHDWVIIYRDDANAHGRWTVTTSQFGNLNGLRIVLGREEDCLEHYRRDIYHHREAGHPPHPEFPTQWDEEVGRNGLRG